MRKPGTHLKRYAHLYRVKRDECGDYNIQTRIRSKRAPELEFDIWLYSDTHLACWVPTMRRARTLQKKYPGVSIEGGCNEAVEICFPETELHNLAGALQAVRRRRQTPKQREASFRNLHPHGFRIPPAAQSGFGARDCAPTSSEGSRPVRTSAGPVSRPEIIGTPEGLPAT
jgi:hypothetical protein